MSPLSVLATSSVPPGIRGALNQWMLEVLPGVFIGRPTARVRETLWASLSEALEQLDGAYAAWICQAANDQGFTVERAGEHRYSLEDFDGVQLVSVRRRVATEPEEPLNIDW